MAKLQSIQTDSILSYFRTTQTDDHIHPWQSSFVWSKQVSDMLQEFSDEQKLDLCPNSKFKPIVPQKFAWLHDLNASVPDGKGMLCASLVFRFTHLVIFLLRFVVGDRDRNVRNSSDRQGFMI